MDSTAQPTPRDSYIINELLSRVTHGYDSPNRPYGLRYHIRTAGTGDALIRQPKQPLGTHISSMAATKDSDIINELVSRVTH